jgi:hypothetical protein
MEPEAPPDVRRELDELRRRVQRLEEELALLRSLVSPFPHEPPPEPPPHPPYRRPGPPPGTYPTMASGRQPEPPA